jgi:hypothetical protein
MPRADSRGLGRLLRALAPYDGRLPAPAPLKRIIRALWWDRFATKETIQVVLHQVYHNRRELSSHPFLSHHRHAMLQHASVHLHAAGDQSHAMMLPDPRTGAEVGTIRRHAWKGYRLL